MIMAGFSADGVLPSTALKKSSTGPSVIRRKSSDGGYLLRLKNEITV
jgi:hypothetical protein